MKSRPLLVGSLSDEKLTVWPSMFGRRHLSYSGGARGHPDEVAAFLDGWAKTARAVSGYEVLERGKQPPHHQIRGYFAIPWVGRG